MAKLFRRIRKEIIGSKRIREYAPYAVGEIVLLVIGILIALQINNWNESRKDEARERVILGQLNHEFRLNRIQFAEIRRLHTDSFEKLGIVLRNLATVDQKVSRDSVLQNYTSMFGGYTFDASNGVVQSLVSSGDYNLIRNDSLRGLLLSWIDVLEDYTEEERLSQNFWSTVIEPYLVDQGVFFDHDRDALMRDPKIISMLVRKHHYARNIVSEMNKEHSIEHYMREIVRMSGGN